MTAGPAERAHDGLRIALLTPCFWPEVRRGAERLARELADGLIARGHTPRLITSHPGPPSRTVEHGLPVVRHWRPPTARLRRRQFEDYLTHVPFSYLSLRGGRDHVAQALFVTDALAAARWSRKSGRPSVFSYMGIPDRPGLVGRRLRLELTQRAIAGCTAVTALSRAAVDAFWRWLGVEARLLYPPVDTSGFTPGGERAEEPTIFCAADLTEPRKRVDLLLEAFRLARRERHGLRLLLSRPRGAVVVEPGDPRVELVDVDDREVLADTYRRSWVSVLPSSGEAFGLVLAEALACGTPVVGSDTGGIREVVSSESVGRLFGPGDVHDLARALLEALELAEDAATPTACRARAEDFSAERCAAEHEALYRELLSHG